MNSFLPPDPPALLLCAALMTGYLLTVRLAGSRGLDATLAAEMTFLMLAAGLLGAHLFKFLYYPDVLAAEPLAPLRRSAGLASFGGILGGLAAGHGWLSYRGQERQTARRYLDEAAFAFPFAWIPGRTACFLTLDHPGAFTSGWLGVRYPDGLRYDLALIEILFAIPLTLLLFFLRGRNRPAGLLTGALLSVYALFRFLLDQLHVEPPGYFGWSVDQLGAMLLGLIGVWFLLTAGRRIAVPLTVCSSESRT